MQTDKDNSKAVKSYGPAVSPKMMGVTKILSNYKLQQDHYSISEFGYLSHNIQEQFTKKDIVKDNQLHRDVPSDQELRDAEYNAQDSIQESHLNSINAKIPSDAPTMTRPAFDEHEVLPVFRKKLIEIFKFGTSLNDTTNEYQGKIQEKAISGLAKILEVRRSYFDDITPELSKVLLDELYEQCKAKGLKGRTKKTTEFHLLSRLFRQSDRKQASADAKVLIRAHNEKQTEKTFAAWVKNLRGLNKIRMEIDDFGRAAQAEKEEKQRSKNKHKGNLKTLFDTSLAASWTPLTSFSFEDTPKGLEELIPSEGAWVPIAIARRNGKVTFYIPKKDSCPTELHPDLVEDTFVGNPTATSEPGNSQAPNVRK